MNILNTSLNLHVISKGHLLPCVAPFDLNLGWQVIILETLSGLKSLVISFKKLSHFLQELLVLPDENFVLLLVEIHLGNQIHFLGKDGLAFVKIPLTKYKR